MPAFKDEFVTVAGVKTRYWKAGCGGTPLVLLHGLGGTVADWRETMEKFAKNREVLAIDLLGNGLTDKPAGCRYLPDEMRDHLLDTLDALKLDEVDLNGWSLGGRIAITVAHARPALVRRLILTAPAGIGPDTILNLNASYRSILRQLATQPSEAGWRIFRNAIRNGNGKRLAKFTKRRLVFVSDAEARTAVLSQLRSFVGPSGYLEGPRRNLLLQLAELEMPILAVWGREDHFAPFDHSTILRQAAPKAALSVIERCGHTPHIEWPEIYTEAVDSFLLQSHPMQSTEQPEMDV